MPLRLALMAVLACTSCELLVPEPGGPASCTADAQCDQVCLIPAGAGSGSCTRSCDVTAACPEGLECLGTSRGRVCATRTGSSAPAQVCGLDVDCAAGFCLDGVCTTLHRGEACRPGVDACLDGMVCGRNDLGPVCRTRCSEPCYTDECSTDQQCPTGLKCQAILYSLCGGSSSSSGRVKECRRPGPLGLLGVCTKNYQCASGACDFGKSCPAIGEQGVCE